MQKLVERKLNKAAGASAGKKSSKEFEVNDEVFVNNFEELTKSNLPSLSEIQDALNITGRNSSKSKKSKRRKIQSKRKQETSSSSESSATESSGDKDDDQESEDEKSFKRKKGKKVKSGIFTKSANAQLVSNEVFAHAALDSEIGKDKELHELSFSLLVAGELEILSSRNINDKEFFSRLELLKMLAYKAEHMTLSETLNQYASFIKKVEKGKFKWGSRKDLRSFEQQLLFSITVENRKNEKLVGGSEKMSKNNGKFEERKKYCLDYNRGVCKFDKAHEGKINGFSVWKLHICRRCLVDDNVEAQHPEKDCGKHK